MNNAIPSFLKASKLRILYFALLILGGFWISPLWPVFLAIWLFISLFWSYTKQVELLSETEKKVYHFSLYFYPILGTLIKVYILFDFIPYTYFWVNRFEHALWAMALVILMLPAWKILKVGFEADKILKRVQDDRIETQDDKSEIIIDINLTQKFSTLALFIIVVGVICLFGNMVEFVEYAFRFYGNYQYKYAAYYPDTIFDMMSNVI